MTTIGRQLFPKGITFGRDDDKASAGATSASERTFNLPGIGPKTYHFPSRFQDVELLNAQLVLSSRDVASWLPPGVKPASVAGFTRAMVTVQHLGRPPDGMKPYTEASFAVRVELPDGSEGWHTLTMPVDSFENRQRGQYIFGYPKEMAQLGLGDTPGGRRGEVKSESGAPLLSLEIGQRNPFSLRHQLDNTSYQRLNGKWVSLGAKVDGDLRLGRASVTFGEEMRRRFPGLPEHPTVMMGGRLTDADLSLSLPSDIN